MKPPSSMKPARPARDSEAPLTIDGEVLPRMRKRALMGCLSARTRMSSKREGCF